MDTSDLNRLGVSVVEVDGSQQKPEGGFLYMLRLPRIGVPQEVSGVVDIGKVQENQHIPIKDKDGKITGYERDMPAVGRVDLHFITSNMALQWLTNIATAYSEEFEGVLMMDQAGKSYNFATGKKNGIVSVEIAEIPGLIKELKETSAAATEQSEQLTGLNKSLEVIVNKLEDMSIDELRMEIGYLNFYLMQNHPQLGPEAKAFSQQLRDIEDSLKQVQGKQDNSYSAIVSGMRELQYEIAARCGTGHIPRQPLPPFGSESYIFDEANKESPPEDEGRGKETFPAGRALQSGNIPEKGPTAKRETKANNLTDSELEKRISPAEKNLPESQLNMFSDFFNPDDATKKNMLISQNSVVITAPSEDSLDRVMQIIRGLDRRPQGIKLSVRVCEFSERARKQLGMDLNSDSIATSFTELLGKNNRYETDSIEGYTRNSGLNFGASIDTLIRDGEIILLAEPDLSTIENFEAVYSAIDRVPYVQSEAYLNDNTTKVTDSVSYLNIGITLRFKPIISGNELLTIAVLPEVTTLVNDSTVGGTSFNPPRYLRRSLKTIVNVRDGEPFVLAGMISEKDQIDVDKVPLLGDIPLVKELFRKRSIVKERSEIYIIVIPEILDE
jgi:type II secretory pathway component GspD/PulD (secretin)